MWTRRSLLVVALGAAALASPARAQFAKGDGDGGVNALTLLAMPISPRAVGIAEAMAAIDRDPSVIWYNTAGLAGLTTNAFTVNASQRFAQTQLIGAAIAFPTPLATFGVAARVFNAGTIARTQNGQPIGGNVRAYQFALEGGGALQLARKWRWGGTLIYAQEALGDETQGAVGINSSMQFPDLFGRLSLGGGVRNLSTTLKFDETFKGFTPPFSAYAGAGFDLLRQRNLVQTPMLFRGQPVILDLRVLAQGNFPERNEMFGSFGVETAVNGVAMARLGFQTGDDNRAGLSLGAGINVGQFRLEYAFRNYKNGGSGFFQNDPIGDAHNVSFTYLWGTPREREQAAPVIVQQPVDTGALNDVVRRAVGEQLAGLRPLFDSLRQQRVEVVPTGNELINKYIVPIYFGFDSTAVREADMQVLSQIADVIKKVYPTALVTIEGFADAAGSIDYNNRLSQKRAEAVRQVMVQRFGLELKQFRTVGYGKDPVRQVIPGAAGRHPGAQSNRRVTFTIDATQHY